MPRYTAEVPLFVSQIGLLALWGVTGVLLIAAAVITHGLLDARRSRQIARFGAEVGLEHRRRDPRMPPVEIARLPMFRRRKGGVRGFIRDVLLGVWADRRVILFEYDSLAGRWGYSPQTAAAVQLDGASMPAFALWPRSVGARILGQRRGGDVAVQMTEWRELGAKFELHTDDQSRVMDVFTPDVCEQLARIDDWCVEGAGEWLMIYQHHVRCKPADLRSFLEMVEAIAGVIEPTAKVRNK